SYSSSGAYTRRAFGGSRCPMTQSTASWVSVGRRLYYLRGSRPPFETSHLSGSCWSRFGTIPSHFHSRFVRSRPLFFAFFRLGVPRILDPVPVLTPLSNDVLGLLIVPQPHET